MNDPRCGAPVTEGRAVVARAPAIPRNRRVLLFLVTQDLEVPLLRPMDEAMTASHEDGARKRPRGSR